MKNSLSILWCHSSRGLFTGWLACFILAISTAASATTYYSAYGQNRTNNITVSVGTHNFQVDAIAANKNTEWYVDGVYTGAGENDWSGNPIWPLNPDDPQYTKYISGSVQIKALIYDRYWNYEQYHTWNVSLADTTPPSVPSLQTPANGSTTYDQTPYFNWTDSSDSGSGVSHYEIEIYDWDITWGDISATPSSSNYTPSSNIPYDRIYWKVRAVDNAGNKSAYTGEWWFDLVEEPDTMPPTNPTSFSGSPPPNTWTTDNTVSVSWSGASDNKGLQRYYYQWSTSSSYSVSGSDPYTNTSSGSGSNTSPALSDGSSWYFHIRYMDTSNNWASSTAHYGPFKIDRTVPSTPSLQTPANGSTTYDQTPDFNWTDSSDSGSGVSHYEIEIYDWDITWGDISATAVSSNYTPSSNIPHDRIYWKVRAVDNAGNKSAYTSEWWFDLVVEPDTTPPTNPTIFTASPPINAWTTDNTISVDWSGAYDARGLQRYYYQWSTSSSYSISSSDPYTNTSSDSGSNTSPALSDGSSWYFHIRYMDTSNNWASSTAHYGPFKIDTATPSGPSLQTPANGSTTYDQTPDFNWADSSDSGSGVSHYEIEIYDWDITWGDISATAVSSNYTPSSNIPYDRIYWKVRAVDNAGNKSAYTSEWWFDLAAPTIISAYWWMPLDVSTGDEVTMCSEVQGMPVGTQCTFQVFEDDVFSDDPILPTLTGNVYTAEEGKTYVKAVWTAQWQNDGGINPWAGDPEYFFEVSYGSVSLKSSRSANQEVIVRNNRQEPSKDHGDFYYSSGEATQDSTSLTDNRIPIILVHGMSGDKKQDSLNYWYGWCDDTDGLFNQTGMRSKFKVYRYVYDSRRPISENGAAFAQFVNQYYQQHPEIVDRQIVIMAHSMGGLLSRYALNTNSEFRSRVHRLVTLGAPHLGSPGANPTWILFSKSGLADYLEPYIAFIYEFKDLHDNTEGAFDLAWYNVNEIPVGARSTPILFIYHHLYNDALLDNSLSNPFCGSSNMVREDGDARIVAYGGYFSTEINGVGDDWPETVAEEVENDHKGLLRARNLMSPMPKQNGSTIGSNDGLVPLTSALLGSGHTNAEKINLTQSQGEAVDHASYLDVPSTMDYIAKRLLTMVKVTISPQDAIDAGARWRIAGGAWQKSGVSLNALKPGQYTIEFKDVPGWTKPTNQAVTIIDNQTATVSGSAATYTPAGSLLVTISPQGAIAAGAQWRRVGTEPWFNSGDVEPSIPTGDYQVEFNEILGWDKPANLPVHIAKDQTATASGTYARQKGTVVVQVTPNTASWMISGPLDFPSNGQTFTGNMTFPSAPTGSYTVTPLPLAGWITPPTPPTQPLQNTGTITFPMTWIPETGTVAVDVTPDVASWTISGPSGFEGNGQPYTGDRTFTNAPVGPYTWSGQPLSGYTTPGPETKTLSNGATIRFDKTWPQHVLSVSPDNRDVSWAAGNTSFNVSNTGAGTMDWTASVVSPDASWLTITSGSNGTNDGTINVSYTQNTEATTRTGTICVTATGGAIGSPKDVTVTQGIQGWVLNPNNGHYYRAVMNPIYWDQAKAAAESYYYQGVQAHLATITSADENEWLRSNLSLRNTAYWLGGRQSPSGEEPKGGWEWITGETWNYTNWILGEPNDDGNQDYLQYYASTGQWDDTQNNVHSPYIIECEPILSVSPDNRDVSSAAGSTSFTVSNTGTGTMGWTASVIPPDNSWLAITSGSSGSNSGTINLSYTQNTEVTTRTGTIQVSAPSALGTPKNVTVTQAPRPKLLAPEIQPTGHIYKPPIQVTITCSEPGATIRYTTDGSDPTTTSTVCPVGGFSLNAPLGENRTVKAKAFKTGFAPSDTSTKTFMFREKLSIRGYATLAGVATGGVTILSEAGDYSTTTTADGSYVLTVDCGWSGRLRARNLGYCFTPYWREYVDLHDLRWEQNFYGSQGPQIKGKIETEKHHIPLEGAVVCSSDKSWWALTDNRGEYTLTVRTGWSGTVCVYMVGYVFTPGKTTIREYENVTNPIEGQDYTAVRMAGVRPGWELYE